MRTIFRSINVSLILAAILAVGAVVTFAQDPPAAADDPNCKDSAGQLALYNTFEVKFKDKTLAGRKAYVELAKQYNAKYGKCEATKADIEYFTTNIPKWEKAIQDMSGKAVEDALIARFDAALKAKNWDEVYVAGQEILQKYPEKYRTAEIVLASVGGEEAFKANQKYNDNALKFSKMAIADLEANKSFDLGGKPRYGLSLANTYNFEFATKDDALAWLNLYVGYITSVGQKNKAASLPYLYRTSQITASDASKNSVVYELIGSYYFDELKKTATEVTTLQKQQEAPGITEEQLKALVEQIKGKVALANGTAERAIDAYARAFSFAKDPAIKAKLKKNAEDSYNVRFGNTTGLDAWIASAIAKPFVNPTTPIAPISDPEPVKTDAAATPAATTTTGTPTKPAAAPVKPATKPSTAKPSGAKIAAVAKKKTA